MEYGYVTPTRPPLGTAENTVALAQKAEELGFSSVAVPDHVVPPDDFGDTYPYTETGRMSWGPSGDVLEMMTLMTFIAGCTKNLRVISGVMVLPLRNPLLVAKMIATLDVLSDGRVAVGCGVGWEDKEFETIGAPPFAERGRVANEYLRLFKEVWNNSEPRFAGEYIRFVDTPFLPKPVQQPHPPIWVGGESPPAIRRAATLGDAWYPIGSNQKHPLDTTGALRHGGRQVKTTCRGGGPRSRRYTARLQRPVVRRERGSPSARWRTPRLHRKPAGGCRRYPALRGDRRTPHRFEPASTDLGRDHRTDGAVRRRGGPAHRIKRRPPVASFLTNCFLTPTTTSSAMRRLAPFT